MTIGRCRNKIDLQSNEFRGYNFKFYVMIEEIKKFFRTEEDTASYTKGKTGINPDWQKVIEDTTKIIPKEDEKVEVKKEEPETPPQETEQKKD
jgi:hypothetical protein